MNKEDIDIYFNGVFVGILNLNEDISKESAAKAAETFFPRRTVVIKKFIFVPHKSISFIEKFE
jgi:hypothetical protein